MYTLVIGFSKSSVGLAFFLGVCLFLPAASFGQDMESEPVEETGVQDTALIIEDIVCRGNENTRCDFIRKKYYQNAGDVLDPEKVSDARLRLGALIQFRDIKVHLERGSERGYVVVVFVVVEASHIQYNIDLTGRYRKSGYYSTMTTYPEELASVETIKYEVRNTSKSISLGITDFNIFGTGKELGFSLDALSYDTRHVKVTQTEWWSSDDDYEYEQESYQAIISYYDPHLFSSQSYFMNVRFSRYGYEFDNGYSIKSNRKYIDFGRRFARYSSVSLGASRTDNYPTVYTLRYGWDSQDDTILPTKGSFFDFSITDSGNSEAYSTVNYEKHTEIFTDKILTFKGRAYYTEWLDGPDYGAGLNFTDILTRDAAKGIYTGWNISIDAYSQSGMSDARSLELTLSGGYTVQTDNWVARFGLGYSKHSEDRP